jgi:hypothetical protein
MNLKRTIKHIFFIYAFLFTAQSFAQTTIASFSPISQLSGYNVEIIGTGFGSTSSAVTVKFGGVTGTNVSVTSTKIVATVPSGAKSGSISIEISGSSSASKSGWVYIETIDQIYTDFQGYWFSSSASNNSIDPDLSHNLLAFRYGNTRYSTGANDTILSNRNITYSAALWNALPVNKLTGTIGIAVAVYASKNDGTTTAAINPLRTIKDLLIDGKRGLDIGTGVANFGNQISFTVTNIDSSKLNDIEPDILLTQVAQPTSNTADLYYFTDSLNNKIGSTVSAISQNAPILGSYNIDI